MAAATTTSTGLRKAETIATVDRPLRIYVGYDSHEEVAWEVFRHSILKRSSVPIFAVERSLVCPSFSLTITLIIYHIVPLSL